MAFAIDLPWANHDVLFNRGIASNARARDFAPASSSLISCRSLRTRRRCRRSTGRDRRGRLPISTSSLNFFVLNSGCLSPTGESLPLEATAVRRRPFRALQ